MFDEQRKLQTNISSLDVTEMNGAAEAPPLTSTYILLLKELKENQDQAARIYVCFQKCFAFVIFIKISFVNLSKDWICGQAWTSM